MHVLCPSCEAEYEIPSLQRPRTLRCARCAGEWRVMPEPEPAAAAAVPAADAPGPDTAEPAESPETPATTGPAVTVEAAVAPGDASPAPTQLSAERPLAGAAARARPGRGDAVLGLLWLLTVLLIAAVLWAGWHWRLPIEHGWPPSLRLYRLLPHGVPPAPTGHGRPLT